MASTTIGVLIKVQTDVVGARFDAVEQFIQNCGSDLGNQYAVIGFSEMRLQLERAAN